MDPATTVLLGCLDVIAHGSHPLVVGEESGRLAEALGRRGARPALWLRRWAPGVEPRPWPPKGPFSAALVRLPKEKDALDFALAAAACELEPGAPLVVFGANTEGIKSAARHLHVVATGIATIEARRHCRVLTSLRAERIDGLKDHPDRWRIEHTLALLGPPRPWTSYPGVFAAGRLDDGTRLLLDNLPPIAPGARVLDFAGGTGTLAAAVLERQPAATVDLVEIDALAIEAARLNVPGLRIRPGASLDAAGKAPFDLILSNPPLHNGVEEDLSVLMGLAREAPRHLVRGGRLRIVAQRRVKAERELAQAFGTVETVARDARFAVLDARRP
jgi:16S rRNA (guanine1207-N2)-methyltransferase